MMNKIQFWIAGCILVLASLTLGAAVGQAASPGAVPPPQLGTLLPLASPFATYIPPEAATQIPPALTQAPQPRPPSSGGEQPPTSTPLPTNTPEPTFTPAPLPTSTPTVAPLPTAKPKSSGGPCPGAMALVGAATGAAVIAGQRRRR